MTVTVLASLVTSDGFGGLIDKYFTATGCTWEENDPWPNRPKLFDTNFGDTEEDVIAAYQPVVAQVLDPIRNHYWKGLNNHDGFDPVRIALLGTQFHIFMEVPMGIDLMHGLFCRNFPVDAFQHCEDRLASVMIGTAGWTRLGMWENAAYIVP